MRKKVNMEMVSLSIKKINNLLFTKSYRQVGFIKKCDLNENNENTNENTNNICKYEQCWTPKSMDKIYPLFESYKTLRSDNSYWVRVKTSTRNLFGFQISSLEIKRIYLEKNIINSLSFCYLNGEKYLVYLFDNLRMDINVITDSNPINSQIDKVPVGKLKGEKSNIELDLYEETKSGSTIYYYAVYGDVYFPMEGQKIISENMWITWINEKFKFLPRDHEKPI